MQHNNKLTSAAAAYDYASYHQQQERHQFQNLISEAVIVAAEEEDPLPTFEEFQGIINDYLGNLSPKKRDKALVDHARYCLIQEVLKNPRNTSISTAQFRFWVKKMFQLQPGSYNLVCHDNKPVAMREQIYDILVNAHKEAHHGGRDKTSAIVRNQFSWIPKELVARFVRQCPTCISRRNGSQSLSAYTSRTSSPRVDYNPSSATTSTYCYDAVTMAAAAAAAQAGTKTMNSISTPALLCTPSSKADSDISTSPSTDNAYKRSPQNYITASPSPPKRPFFGHNGLFDSNDSYEEEQVSQSSGSMKLSAVTDNGSSALNYQIHHQQEQPYSYRHQQQQEMNYTTYSEQSPSYYNAFMNSYHNSNAFLPIKADPPTQILETSTNATTNTLNNSILSHHNNPDPSL